MAEVMTVPESTLPDVPESTAPSSEPTPERLLQLYRYGGDLEMTLEGSVHRDPDSLLTTAQVGVFNALLRDARALFPASVALRDDAAEIDENGARAADIYRALRVAILPTIHNALPEEMQRR